MPVIETFLTSRAMHGLVTCMVLLHMYPQVSFSLIGDSAIFTIEHIPPFLVDRKSIFLGDRLRPNVSYHVHVQLHGAKTSIHAMRTLVWVLSSMKFHVHHELAQLNSQVITIRPSVWFSICITATNMCIKITTCCETFFNMSMILIDSIHY